MFRILGLSSKSIGSQFDLENYFLPGLPALSSQLQNQNSNSDTCKQSTENIITIFLNVSERILHFYDMNPSNSGKYRGAFEIFITEELLGGLLGQLHIALSVSEVFRIVLDIGSLTPKAWENSLLLLRNCLRFTPQLVHFAVDNGIFDLIAQVLNGVFRARAEEDLETSTQTEITDLTVLVLDSLLPSNHISTLHFLGSYIYIYIYI